jgi:hypothetical protein
MSYLKADGFDTAIIGVQIELGKIVYDKHKMIQVLIQQGMSNEEAIEYLEYNVWSAYVGEHTPIYIDVMDINEINVYNSKAKARTYEERTRCQD